MYFRQYITVHVSSRAAYIYINIEVLKIFHYIIII